MLPQFKRRLAIKTLLDLRSSYFPQRLRQATVSGHDISGISVQESAEDVSIALSFALGTIAEGDLVSVGILISEVGESVGSFSITQHDPDSTDTITFS